MSLEAEKRFPQIGLNFGMLSADRRARGTLVQKWNLFIIKLHISFGNLRLDEHQYRNHNVTKTVYD